MGLIELIFHIKNGFFCPECGEEIVIDDWETEIICPICGDELWK